MKRDVIVVGASRGAIEAFAQLVRGLPGNLEAAVLLVMHLSPQGPSYLADRLSRSSSLPVKEAQDGEILRRGCVYVCVPNRHLMIEDDRIRLSRGPKESHARPSVDVLFRSAAHSVGARAIGIVLTGQLDDGTAGLWAIKDRGGIAMVQSPAEAPFPSMPQNALSHVEIDFELPVAEMPERLQVLVREAVAPPLEDRVLDDKLAVETGIALEENPLQRGVRSLGAPSFYTCPECHGAMVQIKEGALRRYRCHTGHGFTQAALRQHGLTQIESTLWSALAQLEEQKMLQLDLAAQARAAGKLVLAEGHHLRATQVGAIAERTRQLALDPLLGEA